MMKKIIMSFMVSTLVAGFLHAKSAIIISPKEHGFQPYRIGKTATDIADSGEVDYILLRNVALRVNGTSTRISSITPATIKSMLKQDMKVVNQFSGMYGANLTTCKSRDVEVSFVRTRLIHIEILSRAASFVFTKANGATINIKKGDYTKVLYHNFRRSYLQQRDHLVHLFFMTPKGTKTDAYIAFGIVPPVNRQWSAAENSRISSLALEN